MALDVLTGRKMVAGAVILIAGLVCVYVKNDIPPNFLSLLQVLFCGFVVGNGIEHVSNVLVAKKEGE